MVMHICTLCQLNTSRWILSLVFDWIKFIIEIKSCINKTGKWAIIAKY